MALYVYAMFIFCGIFDVSAADHSQTVTQDSGVVPVSVGDNVTLRCFYQSDVAMHFSWYRQTFGNTLQLLSTIYKYDRKASTFPWLKENPRFSVQRADGINHLHISDVQCSDSATYFCGSSHSNMVEFGEGVFLSVKGTSFKQIVQQPLSESAQPGDSVTLNCTVQTGTCDGEHSVYWFRDGSRPGILHTHGHGCEEVSKTGSPSLSCLYRLQRNNLSSSDAGTYYCAVASCGEILFGRGSRLDVNDGVGDPIAQMRILVCLSITRIGLLLLSVMVCVLAYMMKR